MNRSVSVRFGGLVLLGAGVALAALAVRRPALAVVAVALWAVPVVGALSWRWPELPVEVRVSSPRLVEGDLCEVIIEVSSDSAVAWLDVEFDPGNGLRSVDGVLRRVLPLRAGSTAAVSFPVRPTSWGVLEVGRFRIVARDRFGLFSSSAIRSVDHILRVYPREARLRGMAEPMRTVGTLGAHLAPSRGDGCEYADVRAWQPGDRLRNVNWRVSARRGSTWVTERHPERAADAVIVLDDTASLGPADDSTLRRAVQAAMSLAEGHLAAQDRVGLLALGSPLRWIRPRAGARQLYAIVDTLLDCRLARLSGVGRSGSVMLGGLRPGTTIVALTVLADQRVVEVLADLRRHGHHVVAVEPLPSTSPAPEATAVSPAGERAPRAVPAATMAQVLAGRLWDHERAARRARLREAGVLTVGWDGVVPLGALLGRSPGGIGMAAGRGRAR